MAKKKNNLRTIEEQWQGFAAAAFKGMKEPPSPVQVEEMKRAFYAGCHATLCSFREIGEPHVSEAEGVVYLEARHQEAGRFYKKMMADYSARN